MYLHRNSGMLPSFMNSLLFVRNHLRSPYAWTLSTYIFFMHGPVKMTLLCPMEILSRNQEWWSPYLLFLIVHCDSIASLGLRSRTCQRSLTARMLSFRFIFCHGRAGPFQLKSAWATLNHYLERNPSWFDEVYIDRYLLLAYTKTAERIRVKLAQVTNNISWKCVYQNLL